MSRSGGSPRRGAHPQVLGQCLATGLLLTGALMARVPDLVFMVGLTVVRTGLGAYSVYLLLHGEMSFLIMFAFRAMDQFIMGSTPVLAVQATRLPSPSPGHNDRTQILSNGCFLVHLMRAVCLSDLPHLPQRVLCTVMYCKATSVPKAFESSV